MAEKRAVVVSCAGRGKAHARAYDHIDGASAVACCDIRDDRREAMAAELGITGYADARAMIEDEKPDIVHLATGPTTRVELMSLVSDLGVPLCTVEKPIAVNVPDWRALTELERGSKTKFAVCHQFRWQRHLVQCQQAVDAGELGAMRFLDMSAGMNITGQGTHTLNYGRSIIGDARVTRVFGSILGWDKHDATHPAPTASEAYLNFDNDIRGLWTSGPISPRYGDPKTVWQHVHVSAYGDEGRVEWQEFGQWEVVGPGQRRGGTCEDDGGWQANNLLAQAEFHKAMFAWRDDEGSVPGTNLADSLHECAVVLALYLSAIERRPVDLADFDPPDDLFQRAMDLA